MHTLYRLRGAAFLLALTLLVLPSTTQAQNVDNKGTDFYMGFLFNQFSSNQAVELHLTADVATNVTVQYPVNSPTFNTTVAVVPGDITIVSLPLSAAQGWSNGGPSNNAVRAFAPDEFVAYMINRKNTTSDAALALPVDALNTDYLIQTYTPAFYGSLFSVVAAFDDTEVTITPTANLASGQTAGTPFTVTLDRGQGFYARSSGSSGAANDLSGSSVEADKPVAVTNGNGCTQVPIGTSACDHIFQVAHPLASWGSDAFAAPLPNRPSGSAYRVIAAEDGTILSQNGAPIATLNSGEFFDTGVITGAQIFESDSDTKPIFVTQYMTGVNFSGAISGDPAMGNLIPSEQYLSAYTFSTVGGNQFSQQFLSVIAENDDVTNGTILLDGTSIPASSFTGIAGTGFSYAVVSLPEGTHTTQSAGLHGITVEGYNPANSFIYPGGARFEFIFQGEDDSPPICSGSLDGDTFFGSATDLLSDDPDNTGVFFVTLGDDAVNLSLNVNPFTPGDETVTYTVTRTDPTMAGSGTVTVTDGAGNTCTTGVSIGSDDRTCPAELIVSDFASTGSEFVELKNIGTEPIDFAEVDCSLAATYQSVYFSTPPTGTLAPGATVQIPTGGVLRDTFSGLAVIDREPLGVGTSIFNEDFQEDIVTSLVYLPNGVVYGFYHDDPALLQAYCMEYGPERRHPFAEAQCTPARGGTPPEALDLAAMTAAAEAEARSTATTLPTEFALGAAYPNPLSGRGTLTVELPEAADVRVVVYDVLGRTVATLADAPMEAGRVEVALDAATLAPGTYVVRATAGSDVATQRITVVR